MDEVPANDVDHGALRVVLALSVKVQIRPCSARSSPVRACTSWWVSRHDLSWTEHYAERPDTPALASQPTGRWSAMRQGLHIQDPDGRGPGNDLAETGVAKSNAEAAIDTARPKQTIDAYLHPRGYYSPGEPWGVHHEDTNDSEPTSSLRACQTRGLSKLPDAA